ncbi:unnamed protein product [Brassica rapa subsp. trilocularis]
MSISLKKKVSSCNALFLILLFKECLFIINYLSLPALFYLVTSHVIEDSIYNVHN